MDKSDPDKTPSLTPSMYCVLSIKAKLPTNKLIVKPIPVSTPTPYRVIQFELLGICANLSLIDIYENINTPNCLPINRPIKIPKGTGSRSEENEIPSKETPALAKANNGIIPKAT